MNGWVEFTLDKPLRVPFQTLWLQQPLSESKPICFWSCFIILHTWILMSTLKNTQTSSASCLPDTRCMFNKYFLKQTLFSIIYSPSPSHASVSSRMEATHRNLTFVIFQNGPKGAWIPCRLTLLSSDSNSFLNWEEISRGKRFSVKNDMSSWLMSALLPVMRVNAGPGREQQGPELYFPLGTKGGMYCR